MSEERRYTLRFELERRNFNFNSDWKIVFEKRVITDINDPVFDELCFEYAHWGGSVPEIIAEDNERIFFVTEYDGATDYASIYKDITRYATEEEGIPQV